MGYAICWCAVRENEADKFFQKIGLKITGETEDWPESPVCSGMLDTGWRVVWCNQYSCFFSSPDLLSVLSKDQDMLLCSVEEHVMASSSEFWSAGVRRWRLSHEGENGPVGLTVSGDLPLAFPAIRNEMEVKQASEGGANADVDYIFEIPLKVAQLLVGFKHDEEFEHLIGKKFYVMSRVNPGAEIL